MNALLSDSILPSRFPVWEALADFWLDTELVDADFDRIARVIAASPYSQEEIQAIHRYEVAPAVSANLMGVAGEWAGFDQDWLRARCQGCAEQRKSWWFRFKTALRQPMVKYFTDDYWRQVLPRVERLRQGPAEGR